MSTDPATVTIFFDATLHPHRSLSPTGFKVLMAVILSLSLSVGLFFFSVGAWPIPGFLGLDVLALYWAFKLSYRSGNWRERIRLDNAHLTVDRIAPNGKQRQWQFEPNWLQVRIEHKNEYEDRLILRSHGDHLVIGSFLTPSERSEFADALRAALNIRRTRLVEAGQS